MKQRSLTVWSVIAIAATVLIALALSVVPIGVGPETAWWPKVTVAVVFFWMIHRPFGMPLLFVLVIGIAQDLVGGGVVGAGTLPLVIASAVLQPWTDSVAPAPIMVRWLAFIGFAAFIFAGEWALTGLARLTMPPSGPSVAQFLVTVLAYPLISLTFRRVLRIGRS